LETLKDTQTWFAFHLKQSDDLATAAKFDPVVIARQVNALDLTNICSNPAVLFTAALKHQQFVTRFGEVLGPMGFTRYGDAASQCESLIRGSGWKEHQARNGKTRLFLAEKEWRSFETQLRAKEEAEEKAKNGGVGSDTASMYSRGYADSDVGSNAGDLERSRGLGGGRGVGDESETESHFESVFGDMKGPNKLELGQNISPTSTKARDAAGSKLNGGDDIPMEDDPSKKDGKSAKKKPVQPRKPVSKSRFRWMCCVWFLTWWIPPFCLKACKMPRRERQLAWREKFALCCVIFLMNAFILFFIIGLSFILCPKEKVKSLGEVGAYTSISRNRALSVVNGRYYTITDIFNSHVANGANAKAAVWESLVLGQDVSEMFDRSQFWNSYCGITKPNDFILYPNQNEYLRTGTWFLHTNDLSNMLSAYSRGTIVWSQEVIKSFLKDGTNRLIVAYDKIYNVSPFYNGNYKANFLGNLFKESFDFNSLQGNDATADFEFIRLNNRTQWERAMPCLDNIFFAGRVDRRNDMRCVVPNYILLASTCILVLVIGFKFIAALQLGTRRSPEDHDKFVVCQVPCYTEVSG
jgi:chitin synthase